MKRSLSASLLLIGALSAHPAHAESDASVPAQQASGCLTAGATQLNTSAEGVQFTMPISDEGLPARHQVTGGLLKVEFTPGGTAGAPAQHHRFRTTTGDWRGEMVIDPPPCERAPCNVDPFVVLGDLEPGAEVSEYREISLRLATDVTFPTVKSVCVELEVKPLSEPTHGDPPGGDPGAGQSPKSTEGGCNQAPDRPSSNDLPLAALLLGCTRLRRRHR